MKTGRRWAHAALVLSAVLVLSAGLGLAGPAAAAPAPPTTDTPATQAAIPQRYLDQDVTWQTCVFDSTIRRLAPSAPTTNCATIRVPMDWLHPDAHPDISLAIAFTYASGHSRGLLTANPGGPGTPARQFPDALAVDNPRLFSDYDLLGIDPRGFGASQQLTCNATSGAVAALPSATGQSTRSARSHAAELAAARLYAQACSHDVLSQFVSTQQMVYDLNFVRTLLGYSTVNVLGYGYGARLGAWYADTYPDAIGALVLDSGSDWSDNRAADDSSVPAAAEVRQQQWFGWLARHDKTYDFGTSAAKVARTYTAIQTGLAKRTDDSTRYGWELDVSTQMMLATPGGFATAAQNLARYRTIARHGEHALTPEESAALDSVRGWLSDTNLGRLVTARNEARIRPADQQIDLGPVGTVVECNDLVHPTDASAVIDQGDETSARYPFVGFTATVGMCSFWPQQPEPRTVDLTGVRSALMVQAATDPLVPLAAAVDAHSAAAATRLVTVADTGEHNLSLTGVSGCADQIVRAYLFDATLPKQDLVCAATPLPQDKAVYPVLGAPTAPGAPAEAVPSTVQINPVLAGIWAEAVAG